MDSQLGMWMEDMTQWHVPLSQLIIMEKIRIIFTHLQEQEGEGLILATFHARRNWFENFKHCSKLHSVCMSGEATSADDQAAHEFPDTLKAINDHRKYHYH